MKNILFIMTDQQRYDTIHSLGNKKIKTPALDALVEDGTAFTRAYTPSPVCVSARFSVLTGKYSHNTGCSYNNRMPEGHESVMQMLKKAGYATCSIGKMHFNFEKEGSMAKWGYDERITSEEVNGADHDDYKEYLKENGYGYVKDPHGVRSEMYYVPQPSQLPEKLHHTTWCADKSIEYIENRDREKPFFLMCGIIKPHPPFELPVPWNKLYRSPDMDFPFVPVGYEDMQTFWNRVQNRYKYKSKGRDRELERIIKAHYYGCISMIDFNVGRIIQKLKDDGIYDDTLIIFTTDHGEMLGDFNCYGKRSFLDPSARVPLIIRNPGTAEGEKIEEPVSLVDLVPTILNYAGASTDEKLDGCDLYSEEYERPVVSQFHEYNKALYMLVEDNFKYYHSVPDSKEWLIDLKADPMEYRNLAVNISHSEQTIEMREKLAGIIKDSLYKDCIEKKKFKKFKKPRDYKSEDEGLLRQDGEGSLPDIPGYTD